MPHESSSGRKETARTVLIVEDEPKISALLRDYLSLEGYAVDVLDEGTDAVRHIHDHKPDIVLLDLMLPGKSGLDICRETRAFSQVPIIMITARVEEVDRLIGLELGADDYVCKPFSPREVVARVRALLRRSVQHAGPADSAAPYPKGFSVSDEGMEIAWRGAVLDLTPAEFRLLRLFLHSPGKIFSRDRLLDALHEDSRIVTDRAVDTHVKNLRRKLEKITGQEGHITTVYGVGYRYTPHEAEPSA